jgi:putative membrane protein
MKKNLLMILLLPCALLACNGGSNKDSVDKADSTNNAKNDTSASSTDTTAKTMAPMSVDDATGKFLVNVADVNMTEVQAGQIAQSKSVNPRVQAYAGMIIKDHTSAGDELKSLAAGKNVTLPSSISDQHQKKIDDLNKKNGKDFDKAFLDMMEDGHEGAIKDFKKNTDNKDADVKAFVDKMLPALQMHLDSAKAIKKSIR